MKRFFQRRPHSFPFGALSSATTTVFDVDESTDSVSAVAVAVPAPPTTADELTLFETPVSGFASDRKIIVRITPTHLHHSDGVVYDLLQLHAIDEDATQAQTMYVHWFRSRSNTKLIESKVKGEMLGSVAQIRDLITVQRYAFESEAGYQTMLLLLEDLSRTRWQALCEEQLVGAPEIYQLHAAIVKLNRKGHCQERILVLSNLWLYNIQCHNDPIAIKQCKWAIPVQAIKELHLSILHQMISLTLVVDGPTIASLLDQYHRMARSKPPKGKHQFCFYSDRSQHDFIHHLRLLRRDQIAIHCSEQYMDEMERLARDRRAVLHGFLVKHRKNNTAMPHRRYVRLTLTGTISWSQEPNSTKVLSAEIRPSAKNKFDEKALSFTIVTGTKTLHFVAESREAFRSWRKALGEVLERLQHNPQSQLASNKSQFL